MHGCVNTPQKGSIDACQKLERAFIPKDKMGQQDLEKLLIEIEEILLVAFAHRNVAKESPHNCALLGIRGWDKKYKQPLVLVCRPHNFAVTSSRIDVSPLYKCADPKNICKQLDAMQDSYNLLWCVYIFVHPIFHQSAFLEEHRRIQKLVIKYAEDHTDIKWKNAINLEQLLSESPLDEVSFLYAHEEKAKIAPDSDIIEPTTPEPTAEVVEIDSKEDASAEFLRLAKLDFQRGARDKALEIRPKEASALLAWFNLNLAKQDLDDIQSILNKYQADIKEDDDLPEDVFARPRIPGEPKGLLHERLLSITLRHLNALLRGDE